MPKSHIKGGKKLDAFLKKAKATASQPGPVVEVGFVGEAAARAIANEFGIPQHGIPERPFFRNAIREATPKLADAALTLMRARGHKNAYQLTEADMRKLGEILADEIRKSIQTIADPPNRPWKGRSDPLVFTGELKDAIIVRIKA